jgi:hypothetical protein
VDLYFKIFVDVLAVVLMTALGVKIINRLLN